MSDDSDFSYALSMFGGKVGHYMISATGIVAALSWNQTMKEIIKSNFPQPKTEVTMNIIYSIMVTILLILLIWILPTPAMVKEKYEKKKREAEARDIAGIHGGMITEGFVKKKLDEYCQ